MNVIGKIGDKLKVTANFNTETTFDFENQMKVEYTGYEDEIIKKIEIGNVSLPLNGTLITGSQSLFGFKTQLQFGRTTITGILSQQKSTKSEIEVSGGAQTSEFDVYADEYEANNCLPKYFPMTEVQMLEYRLANIRSNNIERKKKIKQSEGLADVYQKRIDLIMEQA